MTWFTRFSDQSDGAVADAALIYTSWSARPRQRRAGGLIDMRLAITLVFCCALAASGGRAAEVNTSMRVSATVVAHATVATVGSAAGVTVTDADLRRGYVDVSQAYRLRSNTAQVLLQLQPRVGLARQIDVAGLLSPVEMNETSVEVMQPAPQHLRLQFRLWLQPGAAVGEYPLPVHLVALAN